MKLGKVFLGDICLVLVAIIWGSTFIVQKVAMENLGPFFFTGMRFFLGSIFVLFVLLLTVVVKRIKKKSFGSIIVDFKLKGSFYYGSIAGLTIVFGALLQQVGLLYTTPTKAGFLTGFYVLFTPLFPLFTKKKPRDEVWISVVFLLGGLYLLSFQGAESLAWGDALELLGAVFWALHIIVITKSVGKVDVLWFSFIQFVWVAIISLLIAYFVDEEMSYPLLFSNPFELLFAGIISVGIAFTLQVVGQKITTPARAAIIFSFEAVVASICSAIFLAERLSLGQYLGCTFIFFGILYSEWVQAKKPIVVEEV